MNTDELGQIQHLGFALYGYQPSNSLAERMYHLGLDWFARFGCAPDIGGSTINGKDSGHYKRFRSLDRKVRSTGFTGITGFDLIDIPDDLSGVECGQLHGEAMGLSFNMHQSSRKFVLHFRETIVHNRMDELMIAVKEACELLKPAYGIGYHREFRYGPLLYGLGMLFGASDDRADDSITYWNLMTRQDVFTLLRGVYPWNFLTSIQLNLKTNDDCLKNWIIADSGRGHLSQMTNDVMLWTVPEKDIASVRERLLKASVILNHKRDFEAKMDEYKVNYKDVIQSMKTGKPLTRKAPGPGISEGEMLKRVLDAFGTSESEVYKVERTGELRKVTDAEQRPATEKAKKRPPGSKRGK